MSIRQICLFAHSLVAGLLLAQDKTRIKKIQEKRATKNCFRIDALPPSAHFPNKCMLSCNCCCCYWNRRI